MGRLLLVPHEEHEKVYGRSLIILSRKPESYAYPECLSRTFRALTATYEDLRTLGMGSSACFQQQSTYLNRISSHDGWSLHSYR